MRASCRAHACRTAGREKKQEQMAADVDTMRKKLQAASYGTGRRGVGVSYEGLFKNLDRDNSVRSPTQNDLLVLLFWQATAGLILAALKAFPYI